MSGKKKHRNFNDFLHYLQGVFSNRERHSFERDLESDPFAKEALEGMERLSPEQAEEDLLELHFRLRERLARKEPVRKRLARRRRIAIYSTAAVIASLLIVGTVFLQLYDLDPEKAEKKLYEKEYPAVAPGEKEEPPEEPVPEEGPPTREAPARKGVEKVPEEEEAAAQPAPAEETAARPAPEKEPASAPEPEDRIVHEEARPTRPDAETRERVMQPQALQKRAVTSKETVAFRAEGMIAETVSHVIVVGEDLQPAADPSIATDLTDQDIPETRGKTSPEPSTGHEAFRTYVKENLRFPAEDTVTERAVVVMQFTVTPEGEIRNIRALRSPGEPFTREAERVLLEGPSWNPATDQGENIEDRVRLRFVFKR